MLYIERSTIIITFHNTENWNQIQSSSRSKKSSLWMKWMVAFKWFGRRFYCITTTHWLLSMDRVKYDKRWFYQVQNCSFNILFCSNEWLPIGPSCGIACHRLNMEQILQLIQPCKWINININNKKNNAKVIYGDGKTLTDRIAWSANRKIVRECHYQVGLLGWTYYLSSRNSHISFNARIDFSN